MPTGSSFSHSNDCRVTLTTKVEPQRTVMTDGTEGSEVPLMQGGQNTRGSYNAEFVPRSFPEQNTGQMVELRMRDHGRNLDGTTR